MKEEQKLLPCPFCGKVPEFEPAEDNYGTYYEYDCDCGLSRISIQICELMSHEERMNDDFIDHQYGLVYRVRARSEAVKLWNTRTGERQ
jgi:hypothetical protein